VCTWLVGHARWEEEALLCSSRSSQGPLVMRKHWDHQRRHVTLDLRERERERERERQRERERERERDVCHLYVKHDIEKR